MARHGLQDRRGGRPRFDLAVTGGSGQVYVFPATAEDAAHSDPMLGRFCALSWDAKPNLLNADTGNAFHYV